MKVKKIKEILNRLDDEAEILIVSGLGATTTVDDIVDFVAPANNDFTSFYLYTEEAWNDICKFNNEGD